MKQKIGTSILLLTLIFGFSIQARPQQSGVFIHNRQMDLDQGTGTVSVIHFIRLLEGEERARVKLAGANLVVTDNDGVTHNLSLTAARRLADWPRALEILGYNKRFNAETGVTDYTSPGSVASIDETTKAVEIDSLEVRKERSLRRPGYRKAMVNYKKILDQIGLSDDDIARERVNRIGQLVVLQSPLSGLAWNFDVIETPVPNALCTGEGHVLVTTGLLDLDLTDDELGGVLGHEVAHGVRRHAEIYEERFAEYVAIRTAAQSLQRELQRSDANRDKNKIQSLRNQLEKKEKRFDFIVNYLQNKKDYDQDEEEEADVLGTQYAVAAGFDPEGEARALIKLQKRSVQLFGQSYTKGSRTHPPLERRLKILETVRRRWREERKRN